MKSRLLRLGGEAFWVVSGQFMSALGGVVAVRVLTGVMTPQGYGELALGMTGMTLLQLTAFAGPGGATMRFFTPSMESGEIRSYLVAVWRILLQRISIAVFMIMIALVTLWFATGTRWMGLAIAAFLFAVLSSAPSVLDGMQNAARHRTVVAWHQGISQWLRLLLAWALLKIFGKDSSMAMTGYALAAGIMLMSQLLFFKIKFRPLLASFPKAQAIVVQQWYQHMSSYSFPFSVFGLFCWCQIASERWALQAFASTADVGIYAVLYQLGYYPLSILAGVVVQFVTPIIFARIGDATNRTRVIHGQRLNFRLLFVALGLTVILAIVTYFLHDWLFSMLVAPDFRTKSFLLPMMVLSGGLFASGQIASIVLLSGTESKCLIAPKIGTAVIGLLMNFGGAYFMGVRGVVYASISFSFIYTLWILSIAFFQKPSMTSI